MRLNYSFVYVYNTDLKTSVLFNSIIAVSFNLAVTCIELTFLVIHTKNKAIVIKT